MLTVPYIREHKEEVVTRLRIKNFKNFDLIDEVLKTDDARKAIQQASDETLAETNALAREIGKLYQSGKSAEADQLKLRNTELKEKARLLADQLIVLKQTLQDKL
ncbi:MAG: serine--tRNA ligase, partial [Bacteroidales bacterium]|nr:serine--tRNA ligase [Bacteroidales bacterium]